MSEDIKPALTEREWKHMAKTAPTFPDPSDARVQGAVGVIRFPKSGDLIVFPDKETGLFPDDHRHALAALALYGQPFGFTQEDVIALRSAADDAAAVWPDLLSTPRALRSLASRIASLLPPEP